MLILAVSMIWVHVPIFHFIWSWPHENRLLPTLAGTREHFLTLSVTGAFLVELSTLPGNSFTCHLHSDHAPSSTFRIKLVFLLIYFCMFHRFLKLSVTTQVITFSFNLAPPDYWTQWVIPTVKSPPQHHTPAPPTQRQQFCQPPWGHLTYYSSASLPTHQKMWFRVRPAPEPIRLLSRHHSHSPLSQPHLPVRKQQSDCVRSYYNLHPNLLLSLPPGGRSNFPRLEQELPSVSCF